MLDAAAIRNAFISLPLLATTVSAATIGTERPATEGRIVHADVVAMDHLLVYNRFGSFNPYGMIFALRRDTSAIVENDPFVPDAASCGALTGSEAGVGALEPGKVRLRDCKRPRPLVLRANVGDILEVTVTNLLRPDQPGISGARTPPSRSGRQAGKGFCQEPKGSGVALQDVVKERFSAQCEVRLAAGNSEAEDPREAEETDGQDVDAAEPAEVEAPEAEDTAENGYGTDWPLTRNLSFVIAGLEPVPLAPGAEIHSACRGTGAVAPGGTFTCRWRLAAEGSHLFSSIAAPAGGEADGGSLIHGLFGAVIVEPEGSTAFRSQVSQAAFAAAFGQTGGDGVPRHARAAAIDYFATRQDASPRQGDYDCGVSTAPIVAVHRRCTETGSQPRYEVVHGDLNAVIVPGRETADVNRLASEETLRDWRVSREAAAPFREFTAVFHDELKTFYPDDLKALGQYGQLEALRDGFAINYGSNGAGAPVLANRLRKGPAANCPECLYEEFFLESWANGDPALLEVFPDDPSNVHHSYLNDKVVFRNLHAGKETHVFHLHSHQWFAGNDSGRGAYLDSQTIGPQQGFTYRIYQGGLDRYAARKQDGSNHAEPVTPSGYWASLGSGNRNRTPGDAIFHCHLYPHFAQGMWALWRIHDVLEDGTRLLPDGQKVAGLSTETVPATTAAEVDDPQYRAPHRAGSVGREGQWNTVQEGTPVPGVLPLPEYGLPLLPTYAETAVDVEDSPVSGAPMPGYPFYVAGTTGHRSPQAPLDIADSADAGLSEDLKAALGRPRLDGGLPRHVVTAGRALPSAASPEQREEFEAGGTATVPLARMLALGDMTSIFGSLRLELLPQAGTMLERAAMAFHHDGIGVKLLDAGGRRVAGQDAETGTYRVASAPRLPPEPAVVPRSEAVPPPAPVSVVAAGHFPVNGAAGAPGAPYADPCGAPSSFAGKPYRRFDAGGGRWDTDAGLFTARPDPLWSAAPKPLVTDPGLLGFRRFQVSAIDVDLVVNRAGWHDPQGRINVLSSRAGDLKERATATAEPFYFRAFSGECIELQHTNETSKELELDDFQMRVPTDTIGQHIHLVKFDVTSSDGSGNGFNYEDGTFAPAEILERLCSAAGRIRKREGEDPGSIDDAATRTAAECAENFKKNVSHLPRLTAKNIKYFQTTVQRWFADPILSYETVENALKFVQVADRTMRTVFTHDHFGPSNIQQHGFYSALLIEPSTQVVCPLPRPGEETTLAGRCVPGPAVPAAEVPTPPEAHQDRLVGSRANVFTHKDASLEETPSATSSSDGVSGDPLQVDAREYALAIADFALLYDGKGDRSPETPEELSKASPESVKGLDRLVAEAVSAATSQPATEEAEGGRAPAKDLALAGTPLSTGDAQVGAMADLRNAIRSTHGRPIAPPVRPEGISAEHHDPYLVNYRNEPIPLRVGGDSTGKAPSYASRPCGVLPASGEGSDHRSVVRQRDDESGDMANLFKSALHGDPCTPVLEGLSGDRIVVRLIQGAQEVQHVFTVEGRSFRRNVDQPFPSERHRSERAGPVSRSSVCAESPFGGSGRPGKFPFWAIGKTGASDAYWTALNAFVAGCENTLGFVAAHEVGISEHFEVGSLFSSAVSSQAPALVGPTAASGAGTLALAPQVTSSGRPALDLLYHFGSIDALWNGAWGLIRTYDSQATPDLSACLSEPPGPAGVDDCLTAERKQIGRRLASFDTLRNEWRNPANPAVAPPAPLFQARVPPEVSDVKAWCPAGAQRVPVVAVAVRAGDVLPKQNLPFPGTIYAASPGQKGLFDPDGLMLVPLELADLGLDQGAFDVGAFYGAPGTNGRSLVDVLGNPEGPTLAGRTPADIVAMVRSKLAAAGGDSDTAQGNPFVLRVEAGDCIDLLLVNGLHPSSTPGDRPGDALMPRIVPLNVDRVQNESADGEELSPSQRIFLSVPLSVAMLRPGGLAPVGINEGEAVRPGDGSTPFWSVTRYFAGFAWSNAAQLDSLLAADSGLRQALLAALVPETSAAPIDFDVLTQSETPCRMERQITVFGIVICINGATIDGTVDAQQALDIYFADPSHVGDVFITIPYAFGTLPIRSLGDVVSQGSHGLYGTLVVEPAASATKAGETLDGPARFAWRHGSRALVHAPEVVFPAGSGAGQDRIPAATIRETVILYQDGLNLWRRAPTVSPFQNWHGRPIPDCVVCDDSYDRGKWGASYRSAPFRLRVAGRGGADAAFGTKGYPGKPDGDDLNAVEFPADFFARSFRPSHMGPAETPTILARPGEEIAVRVALPQGRARQRAFVSPGFGYDDLFPGFGSGHSALIGPGKAITAAGCAPDVPGDLIWRDGPQHIFAGGMWGYLTVDPDLPGEEATRCVVAR